MTKVLCSIVFIVAILSISCSRENEKELAANYQGANPPGCNTLDMKYSTDIAPILAAKCNFCHKPANPLGGILTDNYTSLKTVAANGKLLGSISHASGFYPMPKDKPKLAECDILKIKSWIAQGTKNN